MSFYKTSQKFQFSPVIDSSGLKPLSDFPSYNEMLRWLQVECQQLKKVVRDS